MINQNIYNSIRNGVCAVGYLTVPPVDYVKSAGSANYEIVGTGFLVSETTVVTNRHVLEEIKKVQEEDGVPDDRLYLQFAYPVNNGLQTGFCRFKRWGAVTDSDIDIGFIDFVRRPEKEFQQCKPLSVIAKIEGVKIGEPIAIIGYAYGTDLLINDDVDPKSIYRFGPILNQGYISAIAPFENYKQVTELLTDLWTAGGMSGSPVFKKETGEIIGVHFAARESVVGHAVPLDINRLNKMVQARPQS